MNNNELICVISSIIANKLYCIPEFLRQVEEDCALKMSVYENATSGNVSGCIQYEDVVFSFHSIPSQHEQYMVLANLESKEMRVFAGIQDGRGEAVFEETQFDFFTPNEVVDFDTSGRRWEGGVIDNEQPHGYGLFYDEDGNVESECFVFDGKKVCYVKEYYPEINQLKYEGTYCFDCRCGVGKSFDRNGDDDYDGVCYCNHPVGDLDNPNNPVLPFLHNHLRELSLGEADLNGNEFNQFILLGCLINLTSLRIDDNGLPYVHRFELNGLPNLQELVIGKGCIGMRETPVHLTITHCMSLKGIVIGENSFINTQHVLLRGMIISLKC